MQHVAAFAAFQIERNRFLADIGADEIGAPALVGDQRADIAVGIAGQRASDCGVASSLITRQPRWTKRSVAEVSDKACSIDRMTPGFMMRARLLQATLRQSFVGSWKRP